MTARILTIIAASFAFASCGSQSSGGTAAGGGLYGTLYVSPATPSCQAGTTCRKPARGYRLVFARNGRTVTATTDAHGRYRVRLERGRYFVRTTLKSIAPKGGLQPRAVTVPRGRFARRDFTVDTGIR